MKRAFLALSLIAATAAPARAADGIVVVLSSNLGPYQEALAGVRAGVGNDVPVMTLGDGGIQVPVNTRVVIAIGGKAALNSYPKGTRLVYCLTPGLEIPARDGVKPVRVQVSPTLKTMARRFKRIQPSLQRLGVLWVSNSIKTYLDETSRIREELGIELVSAHLSSTDDLPDALRRLTGKVDALWLPPDPSLISASSLATIKNFSWASDVPFYTPSDGLAASGSLATVSSTFREMGRVAAEAARTVSRGGDCDTTISPEAIHTTFNMSAAAEVNVSIGKELVTAADQVLP
jgi:putative tryptophan/tyrosine transport system substrate-binding protein